LLLDANQGWHSVDHALRILDLAGPERIIGLEQPFPVDRVDLQAELSRRTTVPVYADESVQGPEDLGRLAGIFQGVNIKLMKCGGLDIAIQMAMSAIQNGLKVMLGSMSEGSVGCGAMLHLAGLADVVDLDGPWLIANDPFEGVGLRDGRPTLLDPERGIQLKAPDQLVWTPFGA
jgi:L-Ala-D/L-Glu epimerase